MAYQMARPDVSPHAVSMGDKDVKPTDEMTTDLHVTVGADGVLTLGGVMWNRSSVNFFRGLRTGNFVPTQDGPSLEKLWKQLAFKQPPKPKHYDWHSVLPEKSHLAAFEMGLGRPRHMAGLCAGVRPGIWGRQGRNSGS